MDKAALSESDICDRYITPALEPAGWALLARHAQLSGKMDNLAPVLEKDTKTHQSESRLVARPLQS